MISFQLDLCLVVARLAFISAASTTKFDESPRGINLHAFVCVCVCVCVCVTEL